MWTLPYPSINRAGMVAAFVAVGVWQTASPSCRVSLVCAKTWATTKVATQQAIIIARRFIMSYPRKITGSGQWIVDSFDLFTAHCPLPTARFSPRLLIYFFLADQSPENPPAAHLPPISFPVRLPGN